MTTLTEMLDEFHRRPGVDITPPDKPTLDVPGLHDRQRYLQDEVNELRDALEAGDPVKYADALADIIYVAAGSAWRTRIPLDDVLAEVHASNMTKTATPGDGKALKGPGYRPPDIAAAFERARQRAGLSRTFDIVYDTIVSALPPQHDGYTTWCVHVVAVGPGPLMPDERYVVQIPPLAARIMLDRDGVTWHRAADLLKIDVMDRVVHDRQTAIDLAHRVAPTIVRAGRTAAEVLTEETT